MAQGLTPSQEVVEVRIDNSIKTSFREVIMAALSEKPEHRIVSLSILAAGEFGAYMRAVIVIEYVG